MTSYDLQQHATDFVIAPKAASQSQLIYNAAGKFINDDGVSLDTTDKQNAYELTFQALIEQNSATLEFKRTASAKPDMVNNNDLLGQIDILGADKVSLFKNPVNVTVQWQNSTEWVLGQATFNSTSERLVVKKPTVDVNLFDITKLTFTPVA